jgi:AraC-like DNA-binding protein
MDKLLEYVNEHIAEPDLNINFIVNNLGMSRSTFFRKIKAITDTTRKEFVDSVRLKRATQLLTKSDPNISEIAYAIGHSNHQYFSKWFKAHFQMSPSEYISKHKKEK